MATANNKRIEETATNALKAALLRCPVLESFIFSNDKTPSWDGSVLVYKNQLQKKDDLIGRAPIQVKGTERRLKSATTTFSFQVADLRNYYITGGCILFLISVNTSTGAAEIYYTALQVFDLKRILDSVGHQKYKTIQLKKFPQDDVNEISSIFMNFAEDMRKQTSFAGKELPSLDQLENAGLGIESLSFGIAGIGLDQDQVVRQLSTHDFYLYAKPRGFDIEIPVERISNAIFERPVHGGVLVKEKEYYPTYSVIIENGNEVIRIGKGISLSLDTHDKK